MPEIDKRQVICDFVTYSHSQHALRLLEGCSPRLVNDMCASIWSQRGTTASPVDWRDPDAWIPERLKDDQAELALHLWQGSHKVVNPRYLSTVLLDRYGMRNDSNGKYQITETGHRFLANDKELLREIDEKELLLDLLDLLATKPRAKIADLWPEWAQTLRQRTPLQTDNTVWSALRARLLNLIDRNYVVQDGNAYVLMEDGRKYLEDMSIDKPLQQVLKAVDQYNRGQRAKLLAQLHAMHPTHFERLVMELLNKMGYIDLEVTRPTNDKGVDVIGVINFGISQVKEVVQVKRTQGSIGRPVLDQLRGSLPYFNAIRGAIFTLGTFPKSCQEAALFTNAAPITLVDGEMLLDLLFEHRVGVKSRELPFYELDAEFFDKYESSANKV